MWTEAEQQACKHAEGWWEKETEKSWILSFQAAADTHQSAGLMIRMVSLGGDHLKRSQGLESNFLLPAKWSELLPSCIDLFRQCILYVWSVRSLKPRAVTGEMMNLHLQVFSADTLASNKSTVRVRSRPCLSRQMCPVLTDREKTRPSSDFS